MDVFRRLAACATLAALVLAGMLGAAASGGDALPRRGLLGVATVDAQGGGAEVVTVFPATPAAAAGLQARDVIAAVDGAPVSGATDFVAKVRGPAGREIALGVTRGGRALTVRLVSVAPPKETDPAVDTRYDAVEIDHSLRRTLITRPHGAAGRRPAVLVVGGIGCFSVDVASNPQDAYLRLTHDLSRRGFVTMRLEKSGVGDSQGPPCATVDYLTEAASYAVALGALKKEPSVDPAHVYLFGHSIGSIIAPRLALQQPVAGVVVAEGVSIGWLEYELINSRRQNVLGGDAPAAVDRAMLEKEDCMHRLLVEKQPADALLREKPECKDHIQYPAPAAYFQELAPLNMAEPWAKLAVPVLAVYGSSDFVTDEEDHRRIVDIVNGAHPGSARLVVIPGMDHYLTPAASQRASFDKVAKRGTAPYDPRLSAALESWLCEREQCPPAGPERGDRPRR